MKRFFLPLAIFGVLIAFLGIGLRLEPSEIPSPFIGKRAPVFVLPQLSEMQKPFSPEDMRGKVWLLNVWASWCSACQEEHAVLLDLARNDAVPIIGLNYKDKVQDGNQWLIQFGNPYQFSVADIEGKVGIDYGVYGVPETFVIDKNGIVRMKFSGPITKEAVQQKLLPLLKALNHA